MLTITHCAEVLQDAEVTATEAWMSTDGRLVSVMLVAEREDGSRVVVGHATGEGDQPALMDVVEQMVRRLRIATTFVSYHWGPPEGVEVTAPADPWGHPRHPRRRAA